MFRTVLIVVSYLALVACGRNPGEIEFCGIEDGRFDPEPMRFNIQERRILGTDTSYEFETLETDIAKGFVSPFPLALPKSASSTVLPSRWELGGHEFTASQVSGADPDWILIHASPTDTTPVSASAPRTSVLYSRSSGVLAIRSFAKYDGEVVENNLFFCGTGRLDASTL